MANLMFDRLGDVGCKTALRLAERATANAEGNGDESAQLKYLEVILEDLAVDYITAEKLCEVL
jgi:hypothetical protein